MRAGTNTLPSDDDANALPVNVTLSISMVVFFHSEAMIYVPIPV
jgi:hypothetical protein